jgi:hypothetical protein
MRLQHRIGPIKAPRRRARDGETIQARIVLKRMADKSIHIVVRDQDGTLGTLRIDSFKAPAHYNFMGWAKKMLGKADEAEAVVNLKFEFDHIILWVHSGPFLGLLNFGHSLVPPAVRRWAAYKLGLTKAGS